MRATPAWCILAMLLLGTNAAAQIPADARYETSAAVPDHWPVAREARDGAPNVLLIMTDDVGFGSSSAFGGPVPTPTFDALARQGLRYNQFNTTALCSPTRAALLTGRNPHNVEMGTLTNVPSGYDGYTTVIPKSAATVAQLLRSNGYSTAAFGKWHLAPEWEMSQIGPFDRWPTGLGFDYYYGFIGGSTDQFAPALFENTRAISPPARDTNYILDRDLADRAINWIAGQRALAPSKPFFAYYATGTAHGPHHAPKEWLERFRGKFDQGWDAMREQSFARQKAMDLIPRSTRLTPRPTALPAWSSLSRDQRRVASRFMEAYAAALAFSDHEIGRMVDSLRKSGQLENTLVIFIQGDNGGSGEGGVSGLLDEMSMVDGVPERLAYQLSRIDEIGGPAVYNAYPAGWGWAMNAPFQYYKQIASHFGGVRNGMVMSWPKRIKQMGGIRQQFHFVSDIAPTILDAAGVTAPPAFDGVKQKPIDGISMVYSFDESRAPSRRHCQIFAMVQNLGLYKDGWWVGTRPVREPWDLLKPSKFKPDGRVWELYDLRSDFSQANDLAARQPAKLVEMQAAFWEEARRGSVLPIHHPSEGAAGKPSIATGRSMFVYNAGMTRLAEGAAPSTLGRSFSLTANVTIGDIPARGMLATQGGRFGGYAFYLQDGKPVFHYNAIGERQYTIRAATLVSAGNHELVARFDADRSERGTGGTVTLTLDGVTIGAGRVDATLRSWISLSEGLDIGEDTLTPVNDDYTVDQSRFNGTLTSLTVDLR